MESKSSKTALHYSTWNKDPNSFLFMKEIYEKFFTQEKIREILMKTHKDFLSFVYKVINDANLETALEVSKYLEKLFESEKIELRKILSHQDEYGNSIFSWFKDKKEFKEKLKIFIELLRKTFDEIQEEFEEFLEDVEMKIKT
jgi:sulfatase maturation enzyme AslB (radical SAM superfamily)